MTLQRRLVGAVLALTVLTLGGAFLAVSVSVNRAQERQLDDALVREAREEAAEIASAGGDVLTISDRPGPAANDVGPLTKYGVIYAADGALRAATPTWRRAPRRRDLPTSLARPFDHAETAENLRCTLMAVPGRQGVTLLLCAPRADLDGDASFLARAMAMVFVAACGWTFAVASWFTRRLMRDQQRIAEVVRRVAEGDLSARVAHQSADAEVAQLGRDLDETIDRLSSVVDAQRRFIADASHELRSPLTALLGEVSHTLRRERSAAEYREALQEALAATMRLHALTEDLLTLARLGSSGPEEHGEVLLGAVIARAVGEVGATAQGRGVSVALAGDGGAVRGHAGDLQRLLRNLLENAVRHALPGGEVRVEVQRDPSSVTVAVDDDGEGVEDPTRIFEPFYRGATARASEDGGAGLGLSIAREIARQHRGDLTCEPGARGRGARFVLRLPKLPVHP